MIKMKQFLLGAALMLGTLWQVNGQELTVKWSDQIQQKNAQDGFFSYFLGENDKYLYAYFRKLGRKERYKIVAFDKKTMKRKSAAEVIGYPSTAKDEKKYKNFSYYKTIIYDNALYAFFKTSDRKSNKILVRVFSPELKEKKGLTLVTSQPTKESRKNKEAYSFILGNPKLNKVLIGVEKEAVPDSEIKLEYKILNEDFTFSTANQVELPVVYKAGGLFRAASDGLSSTYTFGDDGNLHFRTTISLSKEEAKELKNNYDNKSEYRDNLSYSLIGSINPENNNIKTLPIKTEGKRLFSTYRMVTENDTRLYGYFSDFDKDKRGYEMHGLFYATLNENYEIENMSFSYFDKKLIRQMFKNDGNQQDGGKKGGCCLFPGSGSTHAEDGTMNRSYEIEQAIASDDGSVYLFTSIMNNYSVTTCSTDANGNQTCTTRYYCDKENVTIFKLDKEGNIVWGSNYDRFKKYSGTSIYDVDVIHDDKGFYITYGTVKNTKAKKRWYQVWKTVDFTNPMEYIYVNSKDGKIKVKELKVNKPNTPKKEAKYVDAVRITQIDNKLYVNSTSNFFSPTVIPLACIGGCVYPPLLNSAVRANSYFGVLEPVKK